MESTEGGAVMPQHASSTPAVRASQPRPSISLGCAVRERRADAGPGPSLVGPRLWLMLGLALTTVNLGTGAQAAEAAVRRRGRFLRSEKLRTEHDEGFTCAVAPAGDSRPRLRFRKHDILSHHEVNIHEVVMEIKAPDEMDRSKIRYEVVPEETMRGDQTVNTERRELGPAAHELFVVDGHQMRTDADGIAVDREGFLWRLFDDLAVMRHDLTINHAQLGRVVFRVRRELVRKEARGSAPGGALAADDILQGLGLDFTQKRRPGRDGIQVALTYPDRVVPGQRFSITLQVGNEGEKDLSSVIGRIIGRHAWIGGRNFYIGSLSPGTTRSFAREFTVPENARLGDVFAVLGMWDILGDISSENIAMRLTVAADTDVAPTPE